MKKTLLLTTSLFLALIGFAQVNMPSPSTGQTIRQDFGMGEITIIYSRPNIKGRTLFAENSELAPLGKLWRTGANLATRINLTDPVEIGGKQIDTGSYALYSIPGKDQWEIIINKGFSNAGVQGYKETDDVVRIKVPVIKISPAVETFTIQIANIKPETCDIQVRWGTTAVSIPLKSNVKEKLKAQIETALQGDKKPYWDAANFYYDWEKDYPKALTNVNGAIAANEKDGGSPYYMYLLKARIQKELKDIAGAKASAMKCSELATKEKNMDYVRYGDEFAKNLK